ncbi:hypothetical protein L208DRAFT_1401994 [Tricholoma matsutake]|nr:hypothetical protein L208DRAFT_1401994 [Tricholoma matsutake 945]
MQRRSERIKSKNETTAVQVTETNLATDMPFSSKLQRTRSQKKSTTSALSRENSLPKRRCADASPTPKQHSVKALPQSRRHKTTSCDEEDSRVMAPPIKVFRGMRGKLGQLTEFPLDILFEIFGHLQPSDLLRLARSTKTLRGILMSRSAISVWKHAEVNVEGLPPCPRGLTEPEYANLAFDSYCHFCGVKNIQTVVWTARVRCCKKCSDKRFLDADTLKAKKPKLHLPAKAYDFLPYMVQAAQTTGRWGSQDRAYFVPHVESWNREYKALTNDAEKHAWLIQKAKGAKAAHAHADMCRKWHNAWIADRSDDATRIRKTRIDDIVNKLIEEGWEEEIQRLRHCKEFLKHPAVWQTKSLTDRIWINIKPKIVEFMEEKKAERLKKEAIEFRAVIEDQTLKVNPAKIFNIRKLWRV